MDCAWEQLSSCSLAPAQHIPQIDWAHHPIDEKNVPLRKMYGTSQVEWMLLGVTHLPGPFKCVMLYAAVGNSEHRIWHIFVYFGDMLAHYSHTALFNFKHINYIYSYELKRMLGDLVGKHFTMCLCNARANAQDACKRRIYYAITERRIFIIP